MAGSVAFEQVCRSSNNANLTSRGNGMLATRRLRLPSPRQSHDHRRDVRFPGTAVLPSMRQAAGGDFTSVPTFGSLGPEQGRSGPASTPFPEGGRPLSVGYTPPPVAGETAVDIPSLVDAVVKSEGKPLDSGVLASLEPRFGRSFAYVRIHTGAQAKKAAAALHARAFTVGRDIAFAPGQYAPSTSYGRLLLAHELTHVVQQQAGSGRLAQRQSSGAAAPPGTTAAATTERLLAVAVDIERVRATMARTNRPETGEDGESEHEEYSEKLAEFAERLRAVANTDDEKLKLSVLAGFSAEGIRQARESVAVEIDVTQQAAPSLAAKSFDVSKPRDSAEIEADQVAMAVVNGYPAMINHTSETVLHRQAGALAAAGFGILAAEAESTPVTSWNPPGWVILGVATVVAGVLIGTSVLMAENVADTGIMGEVNDLISAARAAGQALTVCAALAQLMAAAKRAGDTSRMNRIKRTQKAKGCRHSTFSE
jgi:Domain of unknown function (DUF4157)/Bacterial toxin 34